MSDATPSAPSGSSAPSGFYARPVIRLQSVDGPPWVEASREIIRDYAESLGIDIGFQGFDAEMAALPGVYRAPMGGLLLALVDDRVAACGGFRPLTAAGHPGACEMKRLYVRPAFRGLGLGRTIADALVREARRAGYCAMLLDTLDAMTAARALYVSLGFGEIAAYYDNPLPGARYMKANL